MPYLRVSVSVQRSQLARFAEIFESLGSSSSSVIPMYPDGVKKQNANPAWETAILVNLLPMDTDLRSLRRELADVDVEVLDLKFIGEQDWIEQWRQSLEVLEFEGIRVVPRDHPLQGVAEPIVRLDPGMAFGTGSHESTALCLRWLARQELTGKSVLDAGCGSGILSIAAAKLGADHVTAVDIDEKARLVTVQNAKFNDVDIEVQNKFDINRTFDVIVSNILSGTLIGLASTYRRLTAADSLIALAGVLESQQLEVQTAYPFVRFEKPMQDGAWVLLWGTCSP